MGLASKTPDEQTATQHQTLELTKCILVVEDDPSVQKVLKRLFEAEGFVVEGHMDGRGGLDSFHADGPSAVILDLHLPKLSGQQLCKEMKAAAPSIPIIILTASYDLTDRVILLEMGADDYITKPFSPRELLARLRVALRRSNPPTCLSGTSSLCGKMPTSISHTEGSQGGVREVAVATWAIFQPCLTCLYEIVN